MTIKEFSDKYGVPYHTVYEATYKVPAISTMARDREFPEDELFASVKRIVTKRYEKHRRLAEQQEEILDGLRGIAF